MLKAIHVTCALLSICGYIGRGILMLRDSPFLSVRWMRITPHIVDSLLLAAGIVLAAKIRQYPFVNAWLTAKVLALLAYIVVGAIGLRYGPTKRIRIIAWAAAILIFGYIAAVAQTRSPLLGWF